MKRMRPVSLSAARRAATMIECPKCLSSYPFADKAAFLDHLYQNYEAGPDESERIADQVFTIQAIKVDTASARLQQEVYRLQRQLETITSILNETHLFKASLRDAVPAPAPASSTKRKIQLTEEEYKMGWDDSHGHQGHKKVEAIKMIRERVNIGLREAKDCIDSAWREHNGGEWVYYGEYTPF